MSDIGAEPKAATVEELRWVIADLILAYESKGFDEPHEFEIVALCAGLQYAKRPGMEGFLARTLEHYGKKGLL